MAMPDALLQKRPNEEAPRFDGTRALLLSQYYRPELIGSGPFCADLAEWLAAAGCRVEAVVGPPHYPEPAQFNAHRLSLPAKELSAGVMVSRLKSFVPAKRSAIHRVAAELSFFFLGCATLLLGRVRRSPLVLALCPSILTVALARLARTPRGRTVALVHDIQSGLARGLGFVRSPLLHRLMQSCERTVLNSTDLVLVLTETMRDELLRIGVRSPIEVAPIWVDTREITPLPSRTDRRTRLLYSGNLGRKQGLEQIVALAQELARTRPEVDIVFRGEGGERASLQNRVSELELGNVHFDSLLPLNRLSDGLADGDVHLVPQEPAAADFAIPSKIYSIMAAGRTFVATANIGSPLWKLARESRAFLTVPANDHVQLARAVLRLIDRPALRASLARRGRQFVETYCSREGVLSRMAGFIWSSRPSTASRSMMIFEPEANGHQLEWLLHLVHQALALGNRKTTFVVAPEIFRDVADAIGSGASERVAVLPLTESEARSCRSPRLAISGFSRWWIARRYARRIDASVVHFLALDHLTLPLALGLGAGQREISGTLFRPSVHYRLLAAYAPSLSEKIRDLRKAILYPMMLRNPSLGAVHSLDPFFARYARGTYRHGDKVLHLADPSHPKVMSSPDDRRLANAIPAERSMFLLFGYLTERKGTVALLDALAELPAESVSKLAVMLAGRIDANLRSTVVQKVAWLRQRRPALWIGVEDRRIGDGELEALIDRADVLLAPYQRFVGSSGVLMWSARAGKPILTQDFGMMGELVREQRLGMAVNTMDRQAIADAIAGYLSTGTFVNFDRQQATAFSSRHTPAAFAEAILAAG
ncbi:MAG: glycosyltransferase [Alphaproteobacteria bacterium]|nr:glycosyltransferase [Alphaproteobacteria bacterium]